MALIVQKFGGSSVADAERIFRVAGRITKTYAAGNDVVVVLSAQGDTTDDLIAKAEEINPNASRREMDMLLACGEQQSIALMAMAIEKMGYPVVSLCGWQVGITTNSNHSDARIRRVDCDRVRQELDRKRIVLVAGFQGVDRSGDVTTLGRGGSDTTAVAMAVALQADLCQIFTDVDGVYTADPRICPKAHRVDRLSYDEMLELSANGAGVLQLRAVEFASKYGVVIRARSTFLENSKGTVIEEAPDRMDYTEYSESAVLSGIAHDLSEAKVTLRHVPDRAGIAAAIFGRLGELGVNVDIIIQDVSHDGLTDISFTTPLNGLEHISDALASLCREVNAEGVEINAHIAKVSLVGAGMKSYPGVAAKMFKTLAANDINISMISTSPICISTVIDADQCAKAVQVLHTAFGMDEDAPEGTVKVVR